MAPGAKRVCALVACAAGALAIFGGAAEAQSARTLTQVERDRRAETARAERLRGQAATARTEAAAIDRRLADSARRRAEAEAAASAAETRLAALRAELAALSASRGQARRAFEAAIITAALSQRAAEPRAVRAGIAARAAAPQFAHTERAAGQTIAHAQHLERAIVEEQAILADAQAAIDGERSELAVLLHQRRTAIVTLVRDASQAEARARRLAGEARSLRELASRVQPARRGAPPGAAATGGPIPAAWLSLTEGSVARAYGARDGQGPALQGAVVRTRASAQVIAPAAGEVTFAGPFRSYGQVLILSLDGGYALVLTGLDAIRARVGETVQAGQPIGEMSGSDTPAPELYVEVRRGGQPIDPGRWLSARGLAAQRSVRAG